MGNVDNYFSVLALFILFRETIEASIICGVLLQFLNRSKPALKRAVWWGVVGGVGVSIVFGIIFIVIYYTAQSNLFKGTNRDWFKGIISWIAAALITYLGFAMLRFIGWEDKWKRRLEAAVQKKVAEAEAEEATDGAAALTDGAAADGVETAPAAKDVGASGSVAAIGKSATTSTLTSSPTLQTTSSSSGSRTRISDEATPAKPAAAGSPSAAVAAATASTSGPSVGSGPAPAALLAARATTDLELGAGKDPETGVALVVAADGHVEPANMITEDGRDMSPATRKEFWNIWMLVFTTVVREGIESVVFLGGLGNVKLQAVPLAALVGITAGVLVGMFLYYTGRTVKHIKWLVIGMAIVIFFIAAGQVNIGTDALYKAGMFGYCSPWLDERPWFMIPLYDWSACCSDTDPNGTEPTDVQNRKRFFALARAIFGYQDKATPLEVLFYCGYWSIVFGVMAYKAWRAELFDADYKRNRELRRLRKEARLKAQAEAAEAAAAAAKVAALEEGEAAAAVAAPSSKDADGLPAIGTCSVKLCVEGEDAAPPIGTSSVKLGLESEVAAPDSKATAADGASGSA